MSLDAIVVGAGLSGLVCARRLTEAGARVLVLEARDRVGGRLYTGRVGGALVDLGGQWMTPGQPRLAALAAELGVDTIVHDRSGRAILDEPRMTWAARIAAALAQRRAMRKIERLDETTLAHESLAAWLAREVQSPIARARLRTHAELVFACDPAALSMRHYVATLRATMGFSPEGTDERRFVGGAQALALGLAGRVEVRLASPIAAIEERDRDIIVHDPHGEHTARRVVLAVPPPALRRFSIESPYAMGRVVKCFAAYRRAFWRDDGLSGEQYRPTGTVRAVVELAGDPPVLLAFVVGVEAVRWSSRDPAERRAEVLSVLGPEPPLDYLEVDWGADPWSGGCVAVLPPGVAGTRHREPRGRVHFAGTETAVRWPGYMEGAIEAGERAAAEVLASK